MPAPSVIAIDGPVASGKTTVGKALAKSLNYRFIDTGMMYRACTLLALREGAAPSDADAVTAIAAGATMRFVEGADGDRLLVNGEDLTDDLRTHAVQEAVSTVAAVSGVRTAMVVQQRQMAEAGRVVMVGRDIGTAVLPDAAKVYLDASVEERVRRRTAESGGGADATEVRANVELRDRLDSEREDSPLRAADDAVVVDTDDLDERGVVERVLSLLGAGEASR